MSARMYVIEGGIHDGFRQILFSIFSTEVASASDAMGNGSDSPTLKYADSDRDAFVTLLFGRNLRDHVLWLSHLIRAASSLKGGYLSLFFGPPARVQSAKALFQNAGCHANSKPVSLSGNQLSVAYEDGVYVLHLKYVNSLIALFELMLELDFDVVQPIFDKIALGAKTKSEVVSQTKILQPILVNYLNRHLPTRQAARKQAAIIQYLEEYADGALSSESISDAHVLGFWQEAIKHELADFKTYGSVVECFENLFEAVIRGQILRQSEQSFAIDSVYNNQRSAGGMYTEGLAANINEVGDSKELIRELELAKDSGIRYFTSAKQIKALQLLLSYRESIVYRPLTFLRYIVFGGHQAKISNTLRRKQQSEIIQDLIEMGSTLTYEDLHTEFNSYVEALRQAGASVAHLLLTAERPQALYFLSDILKHVDVVEELPGLSIQAILAAEIDWGDAHSSAHEILTERCLDLLSSESTVGCKARAKLQQAFSRIKRAGFSEDVLLNTGLLDLHAEGAPVLAETLHLAELALTKILQVPEKNLSLEMAYSDDKKIFQDSFKRIYGGISW
ncbi:MAG: hypothetical protein L3J26_09940 [Candidatus Polarisedimenticolaceae bacterium]|nr:hypothetical protein [Candidatus Polarisedimenticolaceae bacterium]